MTGKSEGLIFDIQRFSLHDGHGIRTLVFMKGCPLRCIWCSNPESQERMPQIMYSADKCLGCEACLEACPQGEELRKNFPFAVGLCTGCGRCALVCYAGARRLAGRRVSVAEILDLVERDRAFYAQSGGGITVGGGEPSFQPDFVSQLLSSAHARGIHTAVETCGFSQWSALRRILEHTDQVLFDIKHLDPARHRELTGVSNTEILSNARRAAAMAPELIIRFPLIPESNGDSDNIRALGRFVKEELPRVHRIEILPYHSTGESKKQQLYPDYVPREPAVLEKDAIDQAIELLSAFGLEVVVL